MIHAEVHQVILYHGEEIIDNRKVGKFLDGIKFFPVDIGKDKVIIDPQMNNSFILTTDYSAQKSEKKNKVHDRDISAADQ